MKKKFYLILIYFIIFLFNSFIFTNLFGQESGEQETIDIEKIEIFVPTLEYIELEFAPIDDELLIQDLQLKENFIESDEQLNINIFSFSTKFYRSIFQLSYIFLNSYYFYLDTIFLMRNYILNLIFDIRKNPLYIELEQNNIFNDFLLSTKILSNNSNNNNILTFNNSFTLYSKVFKNNSSYFNLFYFNNNFNLIDYENLLILRFDFFKNNFSNYYNLFIVYKKYFEHINAGTSFIYFIFKNLLISFFIEGIYYINENTYFDIKFSPYYLSNGGIDFEGMIYFKITNKNNNFFEFNISKNFNLVYINQYYRLYPFNFFEFISSDDDNNNLTNINDYFYNVSFLNLNNLKTISKFYSFILTLNIDFSIFSFNMKISYKNFPQTYILDINNFSYFNIIQIENLNLLSFDLKFYFYFNEKKDFYIKNNLILNLGDKLIYNFPILNIF
ncbi:MAG: hypothetical protein N3A58_03715, partial [Spirochaetes bacterium]|nr:hypothetical protein [Spirochaetota bacterium]